MFHNSAGAQEALDPHSAPWRRPSANKRCQRWTFIFGSHMHLKRSAPCEDVWPHHRNPHASDI
jgi:hypothetical protein